MFISTTNGLVLLLLFHNVGPPKEGIFFDQHSSFLAHWLLVLADHGSNPGGENDLMIAI